MKMNENEAKPHTATSGDAPTLYDEDDISDNTAKKKQSSEIKRPTTATSRDNTNSSDTPIDLHIEIDDSTRYSP